MAGSLKQGISNRIMALYTDCFCRPSNREMGRDETRLIQELQMERKVNETSRNMGTSIPSGTILPGTVSRGKVLVPCSGQRRLYHAKVEVC